MDARLGPQRARYSPSSSLLLLLGQILDIELASSLGRRAAACFQPLNSKAVLSRTGVVVGKGWPVGRL